MRVTNVWKKTRFWLFLVVIVFVLNICMVFVTIHHHHVNITSSSSSSIDNDMILSPLSSYSFLRKQQKIQQEEKRVSETEYWSTILDKGRRSFSQQHNSSTTTESVTADNNKNDTTIFKDIELYLSQKNGESTSSSCVVPSKTPSCQNNQYTVIIYSDNDYNIIGNKQQVGGIMFRQLVTRIMTLMAYPSVANIILILKVNDDTLSQDKSTEKEYYNGKLVRMHKSRYYKYQRYGML